MLGSTKAVATGVRTISSTAVRDSCRYGNRSGQPPGYRRSAGLSGHRDKLPKVVHIGYDFRWHTTFLRYFSAMTDGAVEPGRSPRTDLRSLLTLYSEAIGEKRSGSVASVQLRPMRVQSFVGAIPRRLPTGRTPDKPVIFAGWRDFRGLACLMIPALTSVAGPPHVRSRPPLRPLFLPQKLN